MTTLERERRYIRKWRAKVAQGDDSGMSNIAASYRILENFRLAARWYQRAAEQGDGDALVEWGYCHQPSRKSSQGAGRSVPPTLGTSQYARPPLAY